MNHQSENFGIEDETWQAILEPALCKDAEAVEVLARLLLSIKKGIESGPEGAICASGTVSRGIELLYLHTKAHQAALKLFLLSLEGNLHPQDEPFNLISAAIERGKKRVH